MESSPNEFNLLRADLTPGDTREWDMRRLPRQAERCLWAEAHTTPELITASAGSEMRTQRGIAGVVVSDPLGNRLGEVPAHALLAPDWEHVIDRLGSMIEDAQTDQQRATLQAAITTIQNEPWEVIDRPCWDIVIVPTGPRDGMVLTRSFVVPEWPARKGPACEGMYVVDIWDLPAGFTGADALG